MISDRLRRAIRLLMLLNQSDGLSLREIARWLDCSQRTVYRDLQLLKASGFEVVWSAKGYELEATEELPQAALDNEELLALLTTIIASPLTNDIRTRGHLQSALQKLISVCSPTTRARWLQLARYLSSGTDAAPPSQRSSRSSERLSRTVDKSPAARLGTSGPRPVASRHPG